MRQAVYTVGGLKGNHCRDRIKHVLGHLGGIAKVDVDMQSQKVTVEYNPEIIAGGYIETTLTTLGYSVRG
ncbi:MAG: cation transporter [Bacillota bacterium]|nr:copper resistance protein CopZ [Bacillota bacterium]HWR55777.1 cation transporter [Negativicutes bacterium]